MIFSTTERLEGYEIEQYLGVVSGRAIQATAFTRDIFAKVKDTFGGRARGYEKDLDSALKKAFSEMARAAEELGADAVVGIKLDVEGLGEHGTLFLAVFVGTAVKLKQGREKDGEHADHQKGSLRSEGEGSEGQG